MIKNDNGELGILLNEKLLLIKDKKFELSEKKCEILKDVIDIQTKFLVALEKELTLNKEMVIKQEEYIVLLKNKGDGKDA